MKNFTITIKDTSAGDLTMTRDEYNKETQALIEKAIAQTIYVLEERESCLKTHLFFTGIVLGFLITKFVF